MISACMIVKDEEKLLPGCLESIRGAVDEIVVVDTGSTDDTVRVAKDAGCRIFHHEWRDSFSEARNFSLEQARFDWILVIDADERLEKADIPLLHKMLDNVPDEIGALRTVILNEASDGVKKQDAFRIFRKGQAHFEGIVHNQLIFDSKNMPCPIRMYHLGYNLPKEQMVKKWDRTERLLRIQLDADPLSAFTNSNLVDVYRCREQWDRVLQAVDDFDNDVERGDTAHTPLTDQRMHMAELHAHFALKNYPEAIDTGQRLVSKYPRYVDAWFCLGDLYMTCEVFDAALDAYSEYLKQLERVQRGEIITNVNIDSWGAEDRAYNNMGRCRQKMGQPKDAVPLYREALRRNPTHAVFQENFKSALAEMAEGDPLNILFVQRSPCMRNWKMARGLVKKGHTVKLAYMRRSLSDSYPMKDDIYTESIKINDYGQLWKLASEADIVHVHNEPDDLTVMLTEFCPDALIIHDTHDAIELRQPDNPFLLTLAMMANRKSVARVYTTPHQLAHAAKYAADMSKAIVLYNFASEDDVPAEDELLPKLSAKDGEFHIVYEGGIGTAHRDLFDLFHELSVRGIHVHIFPAFKNEGARELAKAHFRIHYHDPINPHDLIREMSQYDAGIIPWNLKEGKKPFLDTCIANKLFEYSAAGLPVISVDTDALKWFIEKHDMGVTYNGEQTAEEMADEIVGLLPELKGKTAQAFAMESQIDALVGFYRMIMDVGYERNYSGIVHKGIQALCAGEYQSQRVKLNERPVEYGFLFRCIAQESPKKVLDVGPGLTALPALMKACGIHVTAIDNQVDYWRRGFFNRHWHVIDDDIVDTKLGPEQFDMISCISTLEHVRKPNIAIANMFKLLKPGGSLVLTVPYNETKYVENIYDETGAGSNPDRNYVCHVFSRAEISKWGVENRFSVEGEEFWNIFEEGLWTHGKRLPVPEKTSWEKKHDLACFLLRKADTDDTSDGDDISRAKIADAIVHLQRKR